MRQLKLGHFPLLDRLSAIDVLLIAIHSIAVVTAIAAIAISYR